MEKSELVVKEYLMFLILPTNKYECPGPCKYLHDYLEDYLEEYLDLVLHLEDYRLRVKEISLNILDDSKDRHFVTYRVVAKIQYPQDCERDYRRNKKIEWAIESFGRFLSRFSDLEVADFIRNEIAKKESKKNEVQ